MHTHRNFLLRRRIRLAAVSVLVLAPLAAGQSLQARVDQMLTDPSLRTSRTGVIIIDAKTGRTLAKRRADESFIPASNMKLITSGVALTQLGDDYLFRTELVVDASYKAPSGATGRVILRGGGDPGLADPELLKAMGMSAGDIVDAWVRALQDAGISGPIAELVIDDRIFDRQFVHPTWPVQQLNRWYCAEVAGLNFHTNLLSIFTEPQAAGDSPLLRTEPQANWIRIKNRAISISRGNHTAWAARSIKSNEITLHGDVRWATDPVELALSDNPDFVSRLLAQAMRKSGIEPAVVRLAGPDEHLLGGRIVHVVTTDMETVMRRCNVNSYNLYAECMLKLLGHEMTQQPGTWANGAALVRMVMLEMVGPLAGQSLTIADGSGMSRENRVTPRLLGQWLMAVQDHSQGPEFIASLASANSGQGTLRKRFSRVPLRNHVRAKTGYLTGVSALSGYVIDPVSQRTVVFSIITNEKPSGVRLGLVRNLEERIVQLADQWLTDKTAVRVGEAGDSGAAR